MGEFGMLQLFLYETLFDAKTRKGPILIDCAE
jgi:hypothetical protein